MRYADAFCTYTEKYEPEHVYVFTGPCMITKKPYSVSVPAAGLYAYRQGANIQDAFPGVLAGDREFLMTGISPEGWDSEIGEDDDFDESDEESNRRRPVDEIDDLDPHNPVDMSAEDWREVYAENPDAMDYDQEP